MGPASAAASAADYGPARSIHLPGHERSRGHGVAGITVLACAALIAVGLLWRRRCLALVAQASHELRGPLQSALLYGTGDGNRVLLSGFLTIE